MSNPAPTPPQAAAPEPLTDAELAQVSERLARGLSRPSQFTGQFIDRALMDIPRLLATIELLKQILADQTQDSLIYLAGVREGRRQMMEEARATCGRDCLLVEPA